MNKVGIIIINYNSSEYLEISVKSILDAKSNTPFIIGVIDNGSSESEKKKCNAIIEEYRNSRKNVELLFIDSASNKGFSGGNNTIIEEMLKDESITHICLLNSDVIVPDNWLDELIKYDVDVIGPVTNAAGNEQTIAIPYEIEPETYNFDIVNSFARERNASYRNYLVETDLVTFFCTLIKRSVIEKVGLLDERFFPGSYEDDDYCKRIIVAENKIYIARDVFIHHFGSGSFSKLDMQRRTLIGNENRTRFEEKWNCSWEDRTWKLLKSCRDDITFLLGDRDVFSGTEQIIEELKGVESILKDWGKAILYFTSAPPKEVIVPSDGSELSFKRLCELIVGKIVNKIKKTPKEFIEKIKKQKVDREKVQKMRESFKHIYELIDNAKLAGHASICVFAPMYNNENERDGYVQRIKAIDLNVLSDLCRIYIYDEGVDCPGIRFDFIDSMHGYIVFNSHDDLQRSEIERLVRYCGRTYIHSVLRFMEDRTNRKLWEIFDYGDVVHYWDTHGAVPEEYSFSGSELGAQLAENIERFMAERVDFIIVVTNSMAKHLNDKYPAITAQIIVLPIIKEELLTPTDNLTNKLNVVTYAGGLQKWQNIELMQSAIAKIGNRYSYRIFVPSAKDFFEVWGNKPQPSDLLVTSKSSQELYKEYEKCTFGFVLRDTCTVNKVACPTKLVEYIKYGIIPIMKSEEIGDFVNLGMQYISVDDFISTDQISMEDRERIINANFKVLDAIAQSYKNAVRDLKKSFYNEYPSIKQEKSKISIGIVVTTFDKGGLEQVVLNLYFGYKKAGFRTYLICQQNILGIMAEQISNDDLIVIENNKSLFIKTLYDKQINILHYHYNTFGMREAKARGVKIIYTMHNVYTWKSDFEINEYRKRLEIVDIIVPVSNLVKNYFIKRTGDSDNRYKVIYNGILFDELNNKELPERLYRKSLGLQETDIVIAFVASFYPAKYQIGMIGVMEELIKQVPNVKLLYVGNGENEYYKLFDAELQKSVAKGNIQVVPYFNHKYMGEFLREIVDIFTLPTLQEGCSNAVLEAIYCDKPMILTDVGNAKDVKYLGSSIVVSPAYKDITVLTNNEIQEISLHKISTNQKELVYAFKKMISALEEYKKRAKIAYADKERFNAEYMIAQYVSIIDHLLKGNE
jgi:GT2 family glycosyltransferase/glycosyltransferase involved in cell wall biosynthesis